MAVQILKVATLNLWGRQGPWEARRAVLRRTLEQLAPDALGLQEVIAFDAARAPYPTDASQSSDQARELVQGLGLYTSFGAALDLGFGYSFGNAIVSRFPISDVETTTLPGAEGAEPRALISAMLQAPFGPVPFFSTHLAWKFDEGALRMRQVIAIASAVDRRQKSAEFPAVLVGDFNAEPESDEVRFLRGLHTHGGTSTYFIDAFGEVGEGDGASFSHKNAFAAAVGEPDRRIDYVFVRGRDSRGWGRPQRCALGCHESGEPSAGAPAVFGSDHFGVVAELTIPKFAEGAIA